MMTINEFCKCFLNDEFARPLLDVQILAGWYDWFCRCRSLYKKTAFLGKRVCDIKDSKRFDAEACYVFFKNNCPMVGKLYDQFSICDIKTGAVLFCCQHLEKGSYGCTRAHWEVYDAAVSFETPVVNGTWRDVKKYFLTDK